MIFCDMTNVFVPSNDLAVSLMDSHPDYDFLLSESGQQAIRQSSR